MKDSCRKSGESEVQKWKNFKAIEGIFKALRISDASRGVRVIEREFRYSERSEKGSSNEGVPDEGCWC